MSIRRQCKILKISRSSYYYQAKEESALNLELMRLMDEHYLKHPYKGASRMHIWLSKDKGYRVNIKRIRRLYTKVMGLQSILPSPNTSKPSKAKDRQVFAYLLRGLKIDRPNQVWATDITYIPIQGGFMYLTAIIDLYSRFVVGWSLSNSMDAYWCKELVNQAVEQYGKPEILNTDQGSQYTSNLFVDTVKSHGIQLSMDGKGRCIDNVFIERLWWSVKYEDAYIYEYKNGKELYLGLVRYFQKYNFERRHAGINQELPSKRYFSSKNAPLPFEGDLEEKYLTEMNCKSA
ncbi:MAG: IS3 family transposase [Saprospiraceae bacterium]|nr:IS3 family transposase [Saprospiraceae bacterium]